MSARHEETQGTVRLATRSSPMAMAQAEYAKLLFQTAGWETEFVSLTTSGDRWTGALSELGGKGAFVKEIDRALLDGEADLAIHCLKDIPGDVPLPVGLEIAAFLVREEGDDVVVAPTDVSLPHGLDSLPIDAVVGTSSVRRRAQIRRRWPHLEVRAIRGNANTRLAKLDDGEFDALILAGAGLRRIGLRERITYQIPQAHMLPAVGAGQLVLVGRSDNYEMLQLAHAQQDKLSAARSRAERAMLHALGGHCNSPIAGHAHAVAEGTLELRGAVYSLDGGKVIDAISTGSPDEPEALGGDVADALLSQGARALIDSTAP